MNLYTARDRSMFCYADRASLSTRSRHLANATKTKVRRNAGSGRRSRARRTRVMTSRWWRHRHQPISVIRRRCRLKVHKRPQSSARSTISHTVRRRLSSVL